MMVTVVLKGCILMVVVGVKQPIKFKLLTINIKEELREELTLNRGVGTFNEVDKGENNVEIGEEGAWGKIVAVEDDMAGRCKGSRLRGSEEEGQGAD
jgi:hypothetical protein